MFDVRCLTVLQTLFFKPYALPTNLMTHHHPRPSPSPITLAHHPDPLSHTHRSSGVLEPEELFPLLGEMSRGRPWHNAITVEHCIDFANLFDADCNGVISLQVRNVAAATAAVQLLLCVS